VGTAPDPHEHLAAAEDTIDPPLDITSTVHLQELLAALSAGITWSVGPDGAEHHVLPPELVEVLTLATAALAEGRPVTLSYQEPAG